MPGGASISIALPSPTTASLIVAQVGVTQMPGEAAGIKIPTISALGGWEVDETTGTAAARFRLWDGTVAGGSSIQLADVEVQSGGNSSPPPANPLQIFNGAIFLERVSGSIAGDIYLVL